MMLLIINTHKISFLEEQGKYQYVLVKKSTLSKAWVIGWWKVPAVNLLIFSHSLCMLGIITN